MTVANQLPRLPSKAAADDLAAASAASMVMPQTQPFSKHCKAEAETLLQSVFLFLFFCLVTASPDYMVTMSRRRFLYFLQRGDCYHVSLRFCNRRKNYLIVIACGEQHHTYVVEGQKSVILVLFVDVYSYLIIIVICYIRYLHPLFCICVFFFNT